MTGIRICVVRTMGSEPGDAGEKARLAFARRNYELAKSPETEIGFLVPADGMMMWDAPWDFASSAYLGLLNGVGTVEGVIEAERRGYDAAIIHCGHDPVLTEARQAVDIPVVGLLESGATMATLMGGKYGVILINEQARWPVGEGLRKYGLSEKLCGMAAIPASVESQKASVREPNQAIFDEFIAVGRSLIERGAEALVTACGGHSPMARLAPGMANYPGGLTEIDGVPVVDLLSSAVKFAEMQVQLKRAGSPWISRAGMFMRPSPGAREASRRQHRPAVRTFWESLSENV